MNRIINDLFERCNDFLARWPGVLPLIGIGFILLNFVLHLVPGPGIWFVDVNLFLHLGLLIGLLGLLLIRVYRS